MFLISPSFGEAFDDDVEKDLQNDLNRSKVLVQQIKTKISQGTSVAPDLAQLKRIADSVRASRMLLDERFKLREDKVKALGSTAVNRHQEMVAGFRKALTAYLSLIDSLPPDGTVTTSTISSLGTLLDTIVPQKKLPLIGSLPYKHLNYPSQTPTTSSAIIPAYQGGNKTVSTEDTQSTPEAPISNEIASLAQSLNWNPVSIYEFVKNNIDTEWYWGCMKGAEDTLHQKSGNDCDQAALLTALLRASGFPTRYVRGVIQFFPDINRAKNLTGIDDPARIAEFFQKAGIPYNPVIAGGGISNLQIEHVWVESQIPYANYRGVLIDDSGKTWLGLDTSIKVKGYTYNNAPDILQVSGAGDRLAGVRDEFLGLASSGTGSTAFELNQTPLEYLKSAVNTELQNLSSNLTYTDYLQTKTLNPEVLNIIPANLQFTQVKITNEYTAVPDELVHEVKLTASDIGKKELFSVTLPLYRLSNQQIAISYEPETVQDQEIIDSYGGLDNTPAYLVHVRPVLKVNGDRIVVGRDGLAMGSDCLLSVEVAGPERTEKMDSLLVAGNLVTLGVTAQNAVVRPQQDPDAQKDAERLLYEEAMQYADRWRSAENELASLLQIVVARPMPSVQILGGVIDVSYLLDVPHGFTWKGVYVDAKLRTIETTARKQAAGDRQKLFMQLSSLQGSVLENRIFEDDFKVESMSTAKLFQVATEQPLNTQLLLIDKGNITSVLPALSFDQAIIDDITNAVNQNLSVRIPQSLMIYQDWTGVGYQKENPDTGESGWMLSGMIAGGMTAWDASRWNAVIADELSSPYSEPANYDPASARYIEKILATDMQDGTVGTMLPDPLQVKVTDFKHNRVSGDVLVTFTIRKGAGSLTGTDAQGNQVTGNSITVPTRSGIASVWLTLGEKTSDNPGFMWDEGYTYAMQIGENIVDAALPSGTNLTVPFTALAAPKAPHHLKPLHGDGTWGAALSFAGFVAVDVEDIYNNPISNVTVTYTVGTPSQNPDQPNCPWTTLDNRNTYFLETGLPCLNTAPTYGTCGDTSKQTLPVISSYTGAAAQVILGGMDDAIYTVTATAFGQSANFSLYTYDLYRLNGKSCDINQDPLYQLFVATSYPTDPNGHTINAGKVNTTIPLQVKLYALVEGAASKDVAINCDGGTLTCSKIVGTRSYTATMGLVNSSVTFSGVTGTEKEPGIFTLNYQLQSGLNTISVVGKGSLSVDSTSMACPSTCEPLHVTLTQSKSTTMQVYGVDIQNDPFPIILVDDNGYITQDYLIKYTISPQEYKAGSAYVMLYKNNELIAQIATERQGQGFATLSRGFWFDVNSTYEAQVVLNHGTGVEIDGTRTKLQVAQLKVVTDESNAATVDEIRFGDGSKANKRYLATLKSSVLAQVCNSMKGTVKIAMPNGQTATAPGGGFFPTSYGLSFPKTTDGCGVLIAGLPKFIVSNRSTDDLQQLNTVDFNSISVFYGGLGNKLQFTINETTKDIPIEPVGVIVLGIDGLRQDVLYKSTNNPATNEASYSDPQGCGGQSCYVDSEDLDGLSEILTDTGTVKLKNVTAIFPSITFASWASIFSGKMPGPAPTYDASGNIVDPGGTGILGNEFFARDLYKKGKPIVGLETFPLGMVTLDADGSAFNPGGSSFAIRNVLPVEFSFLGLYAGADTIEKKMALSTPMSTLATKPFWSDVNSLVQSKYTVNASITARCDKNEYECRTVSVFNQYPGGVDWWVTPGLSWANAYNAALTKVGWHSEAALMDESSAGEAVKFIKSYFSKKNVNGKQKRFPAVFSVYLPGIDHYAHVEGMSGYTDYLTNTTDVNVKKIIDEMQNQGEFDNKIFIVTADHGHTAMPTSLTYKDKDWLGRDVNTPAEMSCTLKTDFVDPQNPAHITSAQKAEKANNNLHIWELGTLFKALGSIQNTAVRTKYKILVPSEIEQVFVNESVPIEYRPTSITSAADIVAALDGPMAHIYSMIGTDNKTVGEIAEAFRVMLSGFYSDEATKWYGFSDRYSYLKFQVNSTGRLWASIDKILIRLEDGNYYVFNGLDNNGNPMPADISSLPEQDYIGVVTRINGMNHKDRSGDIVLLMRDDFVIPPNEDIADHRYTTGVACKSWHGSLNKSDSYVSFIVAYPGGNKNEMEQMLEGNTLCKPDYSECKGNWKLTNIVKEIISRQYKYK